MPLRLIRPGVARMPTSAPQAAGRLSDELVSSPRASVPKLAARAPPEPPEEPPTVRSRAYGLRELPVRALYVSPPANSLRVVFARMIAPCAFNLPTTKASSGGR